MLPLKKSGHFVMRGGGNCSSTSDPACEVPQKVDVNESKQVLLRIQECRKKIEALENEIRAMPKNTDHERTMAKIKVVSLRGQREHCKRLEQLWHGKKQLGKSRRSLKHRKTHKKRWASRTTLRRS
jgi:hypothetical protein